MTASFTRKNRGRNHWYLDVDGNKLDGVTWVLSNGIPKPALVGWAAGAVGDFVTDRLQIHDGRIVADEVLDDLRAIGAQRERPIPDWREAKKIPRTKIADGFKGLPYADRDAAGGRGTETHRLAQLLAEGEEVTVPDELAGHVDAYLAFRDDWQPHDEHVEVPVANHTHRYAGTLDLFGRLGAAPELGTCLIDLKTNRSGPFGETALQIAAYRYAEVMLDESGDERPMVDIDSTLCLWLRADGYDLYPFDAGPAEFRTFLYAQQVAHFCDQRSREVKGESMRVPAKAATA
jgi:hypothetical protein